MSFNHLTIGSTTGFNRGGSPVAECAAVQRQSNPSADAPGQSAKADAPVRRNTLVAAMMPAMQSLVGASPPGANPAAPATITITITATATATATSNAATPTNATSATSVGPADAPTAAPSRAPVDFKQLTHAFAHAIYSALRGAEDASDSGRGGRPENPGHQGHHGHHGVSKSTYGDLAQRLETLAQSLGSTPTAPADPVAPTATVPVVPDPAPTGPTTAAPTTPTTAAPADSPLLSAFKDLLSALAPSTPPSAATADPASAKLAAFLHQIAQSLGLGSSETASDVPASGSLINVTA